jgi:hypothetical protein
MAKEYYLTNTVQPDIYRNGYMRLSVELEAKEKTPNWATVINSGWQQLDAFDPESPWRYFVLFTLGETDGF